MSIIHLMCDVPALCPLQLPTIKIGLTCCKCDHIIARWAGIVPVPSWSQIQRLSRVRPNLWTRRAFPRLENTSANGCTPNCIKSFFSFSHFATLKDNSVKVGICVLLDLHQKTTVGASLQTIKLWFHNRRLQFHICSMRDFLSFCTVLITLVNQHRRGNLGRTAAGTGTAARTAAGAPFVTTAPSGVCASTRSAILTFSNAGSGTESRSPLLAFRRCSFNNSVLCNLYSLTEVVVSGYVPDSPCTALLVVIRWLKSQSRMLAPDTPVRVPEPRQFHWSPDVFPDCRRWGLTRWDCSPDIQLHSVHDFSLNSGLQFPRRSSDAVEQHTISWILFWNSANASRENKSVWCSNHGYLGFILDFEESRLMPLRLDLDLSVGLLQVKYLFRPRHISTWHSRTTTRSAIASLFHRFHGEICAIFELQILHTTGVRHVIPNCHTVQFSCITYQRANFVFHNSDTTLCVSCRSAVVRWACVVHCFDTCLSEFFTNSSVQCNNWTLTVSSNDYFTMTQSQNPLGRCCLNKKSLLNSCAAYTICMDHFASLVPNHWYWCRSQCCCLCFSELSFLIISAFCKKKL